VIPLALPVFLVLVAQGPAAAEPAAQTPGPSPSETESVTPPLQGEAEAVVVEVAPVPEPEPVQFNTSELIDDLVTFQFLDPDDEFWLPRRGARFELSGFVGGEAAIVGLSTDRIPTLGGTTVTVVAAYYPTDNLSIVIGTRSYLGLDGIPATGTTASAVISPITGVRYDLVREGRFSLLWDLYSGPSVFIFAALDDDPTSLATAGFGGELGSALALRYSLGPMTGELRFLAGGRAGATSIANTLSPSGIFSSAFVGAELGVTWSR
jgi:hypothetical protein